MLRNVERPVTPHKPFVTAYYGDSHLRRCQHDFMANPKLFFSLCLRGLLVAGLSAIFCSSLAFAQSGSASGHVNDSGGSPIVDATVEIKLLSTNQVTIVKTNGSGYFLFPPLTTGNYELRVSAPTFGTTTVQNIRIEVDGSRDFDLKLAPEAISQSVIVTATEPELIVDRPDRGNVLESEFVRNIPLNIRNPLQAVNFAQGVTQAATNASGTNDLSQSYTNSFRINGGKGATTESLIDGAANSLTYANQVAAIPSVEFIREFKVLTTAYDAQWGRTSGGVVTFATQHGSNALHGTVYDYLRNSVLDANGFNANNAGQKKQHFERNQFGYAVGGPVWIPKLYDGRNRTFFFTDYEGLRQSAASSFFATVPTALERQGNFSQTFDTNGNPIVIYDPHTTRLDPTAPAGTTRYIRSPYQGNIIPTGDINATGFNILKNYPMPNRPGQGASSTNNFFSSIASINNNNRWDLRIDHRFSNKHSFFGRYDWFTNHINNPDPYGNNLSPQPGNNRIPGVSWMVSHTWVLSNSLIFEHHLSYGHSESNRSSPTLGYDVSSLGFNQNVTAGLTSLSFPYTTMSGASAIGTTSGAFERNRSTVWQYAGELTWIKGHHSVSFGGDYRYFPVTLNTVQQVNVSANSNFTGGPNPAAASAQSGRGIADLLLGAASVTSGITPRYDLHHHYLAFLLKDEYRLTPRLTVTAGLRYSFETPDVEIHNRYIYLDLDSPSPLNVPGFSGFKGGVGFVGTNGAGRRTQQAQYLHLDPRLGIAYQINDRTVVRGGFGIFFEPAPTSLNNSLGYSAVTNSNPTLADGFTPQFNLSSPFPNGLTQPTDNSLGLLQNVGLNISGPLRKQSVSYDEQFSLDVQRQLPYQLVLTVGYVGHNGVHLMSPQNYNQLPDSYLSMGSALLAAVPNPFYGIITDPTSQLSRATVQRGQLLRPFPQFQNVTGLQASLGNSTYHALQVSIEKRFSDGLSLLFAYTHSKMIDNVGDIGVFVGPQQGFQDNNCHECDRSISSQDLPNVIRLSGQYELPFGRNKTFLNKGIAAYILGGFSVGSFFTYDSGLPNTLSSPNNSNSFGGGVGSERPMVTGISTNIPGGRKMTNGSLYFNPSAFAQTPAFAFGNAPRYIGSIRSPGTLNFDMLVAKHIPIHETLGLDFKTEFFNAFNRVQFAGPNVNIASSSFGQIFLQQYNTPRQIQMSLRLSF